MTPYIIGQAIETGLLIVLGLCFVALMMTAFHDVWLTRHLASMKRSLRKRPHVTVLVYADNNRSTIAACLSAIRRNRYRQYDIVVVNNASTDDTRQRLIQFQRDHSLARLVVYNKRKRSTMDDALRLAYKKSQHGDIVLVIRANVIMTKTFLLTSLIHFLALTVSSRKLVLLFNEYVTPPQSLQMYVHYFSQLSRQLASKITTHATTKYLAADMSGLRRSDAAMYVSDALKTPHLTTGYRYVYDNRLALLVVPNLVVRGVQKRGYFGNTASYGVGLIGVCLVIYSVSMAATLQNTWLLLIGWGVVVIWFLAAIWSDDAYDKTHKLRITMIIPSLYFIVPIIFIVSAVGKCIRYIVSISQKAVHSIAAFYASQPAPLQDW